MAERQGPGLPGQGLPGPLDTPTGNPMADILMRISPKDGDDGSGKLRDDWPSICLRSAEHVEYRRPEFRRKARLRYTDSSRQREYFVRAMITAALAYRDRLLDRIDG